MLGRSCAILCATIKVRNATHTPQNPHSLNHHHHWVIDNVDFSTFLLVPRFCWLAHFMGLLVKGARMYCTRRSTLMQTNLLFYCEWKSLVTRVYFVSHVWVWFFISLPGHPLHYICSQNKLVFSGRRGLLFEYFRRQEGITIGLLEITLICSSAAS